MGRKGLLGSSPSTLGGQEVSLVYLENLAIVGANRDRNHFSSPVGFRIIMIVVIHEMLSRVIVAVCTLFSVVAVLPKVGDKAGLPRWLLVAGDELCFWYST